MSVSPDLVYRVQSPVDGRGPYRPGLSHHWADLIHHLRNPTIMEDFGMAVIRDMDGNRFNGCALESLDAVRKWFSPLERVKLENLGYVLASMQPGEVVARSSRQLLISRPLPFNVQCSELPWWVLENAPARRGLSDGAEVRHEVKRVRN